MYKHFKHFKHLLHSLVLHFLIISTSSEDLNGQCQKYDGNGKLNEKCGTYQSHFSNRRYIFYDVNPPEGFNLRRDVYIRAATFVRKVAEENKEYKWNLVLPPWGNLYHWRSKDVGSQSQIPWGTFFDVDSLKKYAPVMEMYEFLNEYPTEDKEVVLDQVYFLKNDEEMFKTGNFKDKNLLIDCPKTGVPYKKQKNGNFKGFFWGYSNITSRNVDCVEFHGTTFDLEKNLEPNLYRTVMFDHLEIPLHYMYGSLDYWKARRSMRYNSELYEIANEFRSNYLNSNDIDDNTQRPKNWMLEKEKRSALGGPYLSVHFRRQDFIYGRAKSTPTVQKAAAQIKTTLRLLDLDIVFLATDTDEKEFNELNNELSGYQVLRFKPTDYIKKKFKDGGIAIIDQIICSHARYFIGTHESTFTYRIQEDREILGYPSNTTFNRLCVKEICSSSGGTWKIVWD